SHRSRPGARRAVGAPGRRGRLHREAVQPEGAPRARGGRPPPPLTALMRRLDSPGGRLVTLRALQAVLAGLGGQVAQLVEHGTENPGVGSSILPLSTISFDPKQSLSSVFKAP